MFFSESSNSAVLADFLKKASRASYASEQASRRLELAKEVVTYIFQQPEEWDRICSLNIRHVGNSFISMLSRFTPGEENADEICFMCYRFLYEYEFLAPPSMGLSEALQEIKKSIEQESNIDRVISQMTYAAYLMPANITKELISDKNIGVFGELSAKKEEAEALRQKWTTEIEEKFEAVNALKESLDGYKTAFNFVGLYQGFSDLSKNKRRASILLLTSLIAMGFLLLTPIAVHAWMLIKEGGLLNKTWQETLISLIPIASIELILIYFFRVILSNYQSIQPQLIQIELRMTLCQFIQSYAEYSKSIKKLDPSALEKFEGIIFSSIITNPEKIPSTFDGLEQLGALIKNVRSQ